jgi:hypothetical protein
MLKRLWMCGFALVLVLAACGDSDSDSGGDSGGESADLSDDEQTALEAVEGLATPDSPLADFDNDDLMCVARDVVDQEDLFQAMVDDGDFEALTIDRQLAVFDIFIDCAGETLVQAMVDGMTEDSNLSDEQASCLAGGILEDRELITAFLQAGATGSEPSADVIGAVFELFGTCDVSLADLG